MADKKPQGSKGGKRVVKRVNFAWLQKLGAGVCLLSLLVMLASGIMANNSVLTITYRACIAMVVVKAVWRVLLSILMTYEEMDSGQA